LGSYIFDVFDHKAAYYLLHSLHWKSTLLLKVHSPVMNARYTWTTFLSAIVPRLFTSSSDIFSKHWINCSTVWILTVLSSQNPKQSVCTSAAFGKCTLTLSCF